MERTLLLVDDEEDVLKALKRTLKRQNLTILTAGSGIEALQLMSECPVQVIVSDQRMPGMNGSELLREVKKNYPDTVRVILSGFSDFESVVDAINNGEIFRFLDKPWDNKEFAQTIENCFEEYDARKAIIDEGEKAIRHSESLDNFAKQLEEKIVDSSRKLSFYHDLIEYAPVSLIAIDQQANITMINREVILQFPELSAHLATGQNISLTGLKEFTRRIELFLEADIERENLMVAIEQTAVIVRFNRLYESGRNFGCIMSLEKCQ